MQPPKRATAVCVIRVARQSSGPLITMRINYDIATVPTDTMLSTSEIGEALVAMREFLERASGEQLACH